MYSLLQFLFLFPLICSAVTIRGKLDIAPRDIDYNTVLRSYFILYQISDIKGSQYRAKSYLKDKEGHFEFKNVPSGKENVSIYYQLVPISLDYNLKPNRILIEVTNHGGSKNVSIKAYQNYFGRENFPSADIVYPEKLLELSADPYITITYVNAKPLRAYYKPRSLGILQSGIIASILNSKYKLAAVITVIILMLLPILVEKFDPGTAKALRDHKLSNAKRQYGKATNN